MESKDSLNVMNVLIIGGGGREHALAWKISHSQFVKKVFVAPGNAGMIYDQKIEIVPICTDQHQELLSFAKANHVDMVIVGPEKPLMDGIVDRFEQEKIPIFGPTAAAAQLEGSKLFAKEVMRQASIPTADYYLAATESDASDFIDSCSWKNGIVVKNDGLAAGKGVVVCSNKREAKQAVEDLFNLMEGEETSHNILLEERIIGREVSAFAISDGDNFVTLGYACDYKRIRDNDQGPNTGGMGSYSPVKWLSDQDKEIIDEQVFKPLIDTMKKRGTPYRGVIFAGLMLCQSDGDSSNFKVLEFNARFGDPETQAMLPLMNEDLALLIRRAIEGKLQPCAVSNSDRSSVHVVLAAKGYPGTEGVEVQKGDAIEFPADFLSQKECSINKIFFSGVRSSNAQLVTDGGRIMGITVVRKDRLAAREMSYEYIRQIKFKGMQLRTDIGL